MLTFFLFQSFVYFNFYLFLTCCYPLPVFDVKVSNFNSKPSMETNRLSTDKKHIQHNAN